jgi:hypothetical protein
MLKNLIVFGLEITESFFAFKYLTDGNINADSGSI